MYRQVFFAFCLLALAAAKEFDVEKECGAESEMKGKESRRACFGKLSALLDEIAAEGSGTIEMTVYDYWSGVITVTANDDGTLTASAEHEGTVHTETLVKRGDHWVPENHKKGKGGHPPPKDE